jgi:hypothetical protein
MMRFVPQLAVISLAVLAGCAGPTTRAEEPLPPGHAACQAESRSDPAVKALAGQLNPNNPGNEQRVNYDIRVAQLSAFRACLRRNGLAAPGGVEAPRLNR